MSVVGWGRNAERELCDERHGRGKYSIEVDPKLIQTLEAQSIVQVSCGSGYGLALDEFGNVLSFGSCRQGQLGRGTPIEEMQPPTVVGGDLLERRTVHVEAGLSMAAAVTDEGELYEWGLLYYNPENLSDQHASIEMHGLQKRTRPEYYNEKLRKLVEASEKKYLMSSGDDVNNDSDADADAGVVNLRTRRRVFPNPTNDRSLQGVFVTKVALGSAHICALSKDGKLYTKGYNDRGQLGAKHRISRAHFETVVGPVNEKIIIDVACGSAHVLTLTKDGEMYAFGSNAFGQLGLGPQHGEQLIPTYVATMEDHKIVNIACGDYHSMCLNDFGEVFSFGHSEYGQHGAGRKDTAAHDLQFVHLTRYYHTPRPVSPFSRELDGEDNYVPGASIKSAAGYSLVRDRMGRLWSYGWNGFGVLGHGAGALHNQPRIIEGLAGVKVKHVAPGPNQVLVIVEQLGSQFAHSYRSLLPPRELKSSEGTHFDVKLSSKPTKWKSDDDQPFVFGHKFVVFARCPQLKHYYDPEKAEITLPHHVVPLVLFALVEYLYCDTIRSCPPHKLVDLESLAQSLGLKHLAGICALARYQRSSVISQTTKKSLTTDLFPSTFHQDMKTAVRADQYHNVFFTAADMDDDEQEQEQESIPCGHTKFSWIDSPKQKENMAKSAHVQIVCRYPFFSKLLMGSFKESIASHDMETRKRNPVLLHNLTPKGLSALLQWMYCGDRSTIEPDTVMSLLASARCFGVDDLAQVCEHFILERIDQDNVEYIEPFARDINSPRLLYRCQKVKQ